METRLKEFVASRVDARFTVIEPRPSVETGGKGQEHDVERPDWSEVLALVHRAGNAHAEAHKRARQLETELRELSEGASRAIERLQKQVEDLQRQLDQSEARRAHAEDGLLRLCTAIREHFPGSAETDVERARDGPERLSAEAS
jgi:chromosome segregation ATPase